MKIIMLTQIYLAYKVTRITPDRYSRSQQSHVQKYEQQKSDGFNRHTCCIVPQASQAVKVGEYINSRIFYASCQVCEKIEAT